MKTLEKKEKLVNRFSFRMTNSETKQLETAAQALGCRPSDAARLAVQALVIATSTPSNQI